MKRTVFPILACLMFVVAVFPVRPDTFEQGRAAFKANKPQEAISLLEISLKENPSNADAVYFLSAAYEITGQYDQEIELLQDSIKKGIGETHVLYYTMGNAYARKGDQIAARSNFNKSIDAKKDFAVAYYNRANSEVRTANYPEAKSDYLAFIALAPNHNKVADAKAMIAAIDGELAAAEARHQAEVAKQAEEAKQAQEAAARKAAEEEKRKQDEIARQAEEARRKALLESAFKGLTDAPSDQSMIGPGSEQVQGQQDQFSREN